MPKPLDGGCACGRIRYTCVAEPIFHLVCHCRDCQRASGSAFAEAVFVPADALQVSGDEPKYHTVTAESGRAMQRGFCSACGSPLLIRKPDNPQIAILLAAGLDDPDVFKPTLEIFTAKAQAWTQTGRWVQKLPGGPGTTLMETIQAYFRQRVT